MTCIYNKKYFRPSYYSLNHLSRYYEESPNNGVSSFSFSFPSEFKIDCTFQFNLIKLKISSIKNLVIQYQPVMDGITTEFSVSQESQHTFL